MSSQPEQAAPQDASLHAMANLVASTRGVQDALAVVCDIMQDKGIEKGAGKGKGDGARSSDGADAKGSGKDHAQGASWELDDRLGSDAASRDGDRMPDGDSSDDSEIRAFGRPPLRLLPPGVNEAAFFKGNVKGKDKDKGKGKGKGKLLEEQREVFRTVLRTLDQKDHPWTDEPLYNVTTRIDRKEIGPDGIAKHDISWQTRWLPRAAVCRHYGFDLEILNMLEDPGP